MTAQQATKKAATMKFATKLAAARAAEISLLLLLVQDLDQSQDLLLVIEEEGGPIPTLLLATIGVVGPDSRSPVRLRSNKNEEVLHGKSKNRERRQSRSVSVEEKPYRKSRSSPVDESRFRHNKRLRSKFVHDKQCLPKKSDESKYRRSRPSDKRRSRSTSVEKVEHNNGGSSSHKELDESNFEQRKLKSRSTKGKHHTGDRYGSRYERSQKDLLSQRQ
ncbi:hypothetical protein HN51_009300 [Arachis hypogaea]